MGFFAVAGLTSEPTFKVHACHFNLWCLPKRILFLEFFCDVGLRIESLSDSFREFEVSLPFETENDAFIDLSKLVLDETTAELIFGQPVEFREGNRVVYSGASVHEGTIDEEVLNLHSERVRRISEKSGNWYSIWRLQFHRFIKSGENIYVRFRFKIKGTGRTWNSKGWGLAKRGALVDLRVCDIRESLSVPGWDDIEGRVVSLPKVNLFIILPAVLLAKAVSPKIYYVRLLEGKVWSKYLNADGRARALDRLTIYQWRGPLSRDGSSGVGAEDPPVSVHKPLRVFMDLSEEFGIKLLLSYVMAALAGPLVLLVARFFWSVP